VKVHSRSMNEMEETVRVQIYCVATHLCFTCTKAEKSYGSSKL
jgi:hypothetical protein